MSRLIALIIVLCALMTRLAHAQITGQDFCQSANPAKSSAVINCSGTGECLLVGLVANQQDPGLDRLRYRQDAFDWRDDRGKEPQRAAGLHDGAGGESTMSESPGTSPTAVGVITYVQK